MEHIIFSHIMSHLEEFKILSDIQHCFRKYNSCETQLLNILEDLARNLDHGQQSDIILLDFAKAFDTVLPTPFAEATPLRHTRYNQQVDSSLALL